MNKKENIDPIAKNQAAFAEASRAVNDLYNNIEKDSKNTSNDERFEFHENTSRQSFAPIYLMELNKFEIPDDMKQEINNHVLIKPILKWLDTYDLPITFTIYAKLAISSLIWDRYSSIVFIRKMIDEFTYKSITTEDIIRTFPNGFYDNVTLKKQTMTIDKISTKWDRFCKKILG